MSAWPPPLDIRGKEERGGEERWTGGDRAVIHGATLFSPGARRGVSKSRPRAEPSGAKERLTRLPHVERVSEGLEDVRLCPLHRTATSTVEEEEKNEKGKVHKAGYRIRTAPGGAPTKTRSRALPAAPTLMPSLRPAGVPPGGFPPNTSSAYSLGYENERPVDIWVRHLKEGQENRALRQVESEGR